MKKFQIPIFKKIVGVLNKVLNDNDVAIVPRADGIYVAYKEGGVTIEKKIYDERHNDEIAGMSNGLAPNEGTIRSSFLQGDSVRAEEMNAARFGIPTSASVTGTTAVSPVEDFITLRDGDNNGKISFRLNSETFTDIDLPLDTLEYSAVEIVKHVNYVAPLTATTSRGMSIKFPVGEFNQALVKSFRIYLKAGETYSVKIYDGDTNTDLLYVQEVSPTETKFYTITPTEPIIVGTGVSNGITIIVEGSSFDYFYPVATSNYTKSFTDGTEDAMFDITNTLPIKLNAYPCVALDDSIENVMDFVMNKINELVASSISYTFTDKVEITFDPGFLEFEVLNSSATDIMNMLGFTSGKVTVYGEGYSGAEAAGLLLRLNEEGKIDSAFLPE